jgi:hypothetical protein
MKKNILTLALVAFLGLLSAPTVLGQALSDLEGKWSLKKNSDRWGDVTQTVEFKSDKFTYRIQSKAGDTLLFAKGSVKVEKLGPFKCIKFTDIQGGYSEDGLEAINDDRVAIYATGWNTLTIALNFDAYRDGEDPVADTFKKEKN